MSFRRRRRAVQIAAAWVVAGASCGTHVLVGNEEQPVSGSARPPRGDAGAGNAKPDTDAGAIVCGESICTPRELGAGFGVGAPCCFAVTKCGARFSNVCVELDSAGALDTHCPAGGAYPGCCRADGTCGIAATGTAFGCVDPFVFFPTMVLGTCAYGERHDAAP